MKSFKTILGVFLICGLYDWAAEGFSRQMDATFGEWSLTVFVVVIVGVLYFFRGKI